MRIHKCTGSYIPSLKFIVAKWFWRKFSKLFTKRKGQLGYVLSELYIIPREVGTYLDNIKNIDFEQPNNTTNNKQKCPLNNPCIISYELAEFLNMRSNPCISRNHAVRLIWKYIKQHNLQNPTSKRVSCDYKLRRLLNLQSYQTFMYSELKMYLKPHFLSSTVKCKNCRSNYCEQLKFHTIDRHVKHYYNQTIPTYFP